MAAIIALLAVMSCYVDFAIWGGHHLRTLKNWKASGIIPGLPDENGRTTLQHQEQRGPPGYHYWRKCWNAFEHGMVYSDACDAIWLRRYANMIRDFDIRFKDVKVDAIWALLY